MRTTLLTPLLTMLLATLLGGLPHGAAAQAYTTFEPPTAQQSGNFGLAVALGDVTGDGAAEVVVASRQSEPPSQVANGAGRVFVFDRTGRELLLVLNPPAPEPDGSFGQAVAVGGDADGDGLDDVFVCAPNEDPGGVDRAGQLHVFSGSTGSLIRSQPSPNPEVRGYFCSTLARVGDLDGDGRADVLVGALVEDGGATNAGRVYAFSSATGAVLHTLASPNATATSSFGSTLAPTGDANGDGRPDVLVAAEGEIVEGRGGSGRVYLFSGADGALLKTYDAVDYESEAAFGVSLAPAGDLDGDAFPDLFVAVKQRALDSGRLHALSGADGRVLYSRGSPNAQKGDEFGIGFINGLAAAGDLDGDGRADVLVGASGEDELGNNAGRAYTFSGADGKLLGTYASPNAGTASLFGAAVAAGDATGDGRAELLVGAVFESGGASFSGRAYLAESPRASVAVEEVPAAAVASFAAAPNPARTAAAVRFTLAAPAEVRVAVYDALGRRVALVAGGMLPAGAHAVPMSVGAWPAGVYLVRLQAGAHARVQPLVVVR